MIDATELRLDNWVLGDGSPTQVTQMDFEQWTFDILKPIPITPEILTIAGFEETSIVPRKYYLDHTHMNTVKGWKRTQGAYVSINCGLDRAAGKCCGHVDYVHELQNLYFAVTKTELQINLRALVTP